MRGSGFTKGVMGFGKNYFGCNITSMNASSIYRLCNSSMLSRSFGSFHIQAVNLQSMTTPSSVLVKIALLSTELTEVELSEESEIEGLGALLEKAVMQIVKEPRGLGISGCSS